MGGNDGTNFENSNITMESGTVYLIYGGGKSLTQNSISTVENSKVTVNGGTVLATIYGGGLMFTNTNNSSVTINNGRISAICGGGCASAVINGVAYSAGTETEPQNSKNRTINANIIINGGIIDSTPTGLGTVFGGGQGYSYVENAKVTVNNGDLSKAYITAGGSNGYTKNANVQISGGNINILQSVNRGKIEDTKIHMDGGRIENVYIGGENATGVTGTINKVYFDLVNGNITNLKPGISNGTAINVDGQNYKVVYVQGKVINSNIGEKEVKITYTFSVQEDEITMYQNQNKKLNYLIVTTPAGYEGLFENETITWNSDNENIAIIDENGNVKASNIGTTNITASIMNERFDTVKVKVLFNPIGVVVAEVLLLLVLILIVYFRIRF